MEIEYECDFESLLIELAELYEKPAPSKAACHRWWQALIAYPWAVVEQALLAHAQQSKFFPRPADVTERINAADGRPSPEEAWAIAIQAAHEENTVVWSEEITTAWELARPMFAGRDPIGARLCFLKAYSRMVDAARAELRPAVWSVSLGIDQDKRAGALRIAIMAGRLERNRALELLGPEGAHKASLRGAQSVTGLLAHASNVIGFPDEHGRNAQRRFARAVAEGLAMAEERTARQRALKRPGPTPSEAKARAQAGLAHLQDTMRRG